MEGTHFFVKFKISDLPCAFSRATCSEYLSVTYAYVWLPVSRSRLRDSRPFGERVMWNTLAYASYAAYAPRMAAYRAFSRYATLDTHGWYADVENSYCKFTVHSRCAPYPSSCSPHPAKILRERMRQTRPSTMRVGMDNGYRYFVRGSNKNYFRTKLPQRIAPGSGRGLLSFLEALGCEPIIRICVKIIRPPLHCALPPHHLAHARNAGNGYREFCAVVLSLVCRSHVRTMQRAAHNCPPCVDADTPLGSGSPVSMGWRNICGNILALNIASPSSSLLSCNPV